MARQLVEAEDSPTRRLGSLVEEMMTAPIKSLSTSASLLAVLACGGGQTTPDAPADSVAGERRVVLQETDSVFVSRPFRFYLNQKGEYIVTDDGSARIMWFGPGGQLEFAIGRRGRGPGEFQAPGAVVLLDDSTVAVEERRARALKVLRVPGGQELRTVRFTGAVADDNVLIRDTVWFGVIAPRLGQGPGVYLGLGSLVQWAVADSFTTTRWDGPASDLLSGQTLGPLGLLASQVITVRDSVIFSKFGTRDTVHARLRNGDFLGAWPVPRKNRRGVSRAAIDYALDRKNWNDPKFRRRYWANEEFSQDVRLASLDNGWLVLVTLDATVDGDALNGILKMTILDVERGRACVDRVIPHAGVATPLALVRGDTVVTLTQELDTDQRVRLVATHFPVIPASCDWVPLEKAPAPTK